MNAPPEPYGLDFQHLPRKVFCKMNVLQSDSFLGLGCWRRAVRQLDFARHLRICYRVTNNEDNENIANDSSTNQENNPFVYQAFATGGRNANRLINEMSPNPEVSRAVI